MKPDTERPLPGEIAEAKLNPNGWVYRIAGKFEQRDRVPAEAVIGAWTVDAQGTIVGSFVRNENYNPVRWPYDME